MEGRTITIHFGKNGLDYIQGILFGVFGYIGSNDFSILEQMYNIRVYEEISGILNEPEGYRLEAGVYNE